MSERNRNSFRPHLEQLEDRITPSTIIDEGGVATLKGVLAVTPPAAQAVPQTIAINQQVSSVTLPTGDVLPGHGLKTGEAETHGVINWEPTR